jgi:hypothetical protein
VAAIPTVLSAPVEPPKDCIAAVLPASVPRAGIPLAIFANVTGAAAGATVIAAGAIALPAV